MLFQKVKEASDLTFSFRAEIEDILRHSLVDIRHKDKLIDIVVLIERT